MPWETESGLRDDFHIHVDMATFEVREEIGGNLCLVLTGTDPKDPDFIPSLLYSCGNGWETADGGSAHHFKGKNKFNSATKAGRLVDRVAEVLSEDVHKLGDPVDAKTWVGLVMHIIVEEREYTFQGETGTTRDQLPTEIWLSEKDYLQSVSGSGNVSTGSKKAEQVRQRMANKKVDTPILARLDSFAKLSGTFEEFIEKALELDEVAEDDDLVEQVSDDSKTGFYATHH